MGRFLNWKSHSRFERNSILLIIGIVIVVSIGGIIVIGAFFVLLFAC